jgi:colanic acid/amylovoran biosynthesis glycosyltransferase
MQTSDNSFSQPGVNDQPSRAREVNVPRRSSAKERFAYLVNRYPEASQSFIRREIVALERLGVEVQRYVVRHWEGTLVDEEDKRENARSRAILDTPVRDFAWAVGSTLASRPRAFLRALELSWRLSRSSPRGFAYHGMYLAEACVLRRWLQDEGIGHVHAHFGTNSACVAMLCHELGGPKYSFTVHGPDEFDRPGQLGLAEKVKRSEFVVGISKFGKSQLMRWSNFTDWKKIHVVHCGVDRQFLESDPTPIPAAPRVVCVGRLAHAKGQSLLIEAAARLKQEGLEFEIVLAGSGPMHQELEALVTQYDVADRVRLLGWVSNARVRQELIASRAMVLPSFAEGLPVAIMEAFAMGRPVIATRVAAIPELVEDDATGWLIEPGALGSLVNALRDLFTSHPERLAKMGRRGRARVRDRHNIDREAAKLLMLLRGQMPEPERPHPEARRPLVVGVDQEPASLRVPRSQRRPEPSRPMTRH